MPDELDPFDIEAYPEEARELAKLAAQRYQETQATAAKYQGIELDPENLKRAADMFSAYTDPQRSSQYRELMARQWDVLPEGMTLDELGDLAKQVVAAREAEMPMQYGDEMDPAQFYKALEDGLMSRVREEFKSYQQQQDERMLEAQMNRDVEEITAQEQRLYKQLEKDGRSVSDKERELLEARIALRLQREELNAENYQSFVKETWEDLENYVSERAAEILKIQGKAPRTEGKKESATPGGKTVVTDFKSAQKYLDEMFPNG